MKRGVLLAIVVASVMLAAYALVGLQHLSRVPSATGTVSQARTRLADAGFMVVTVDKLGRVAEPHDLEVVVSQDPRAGSVRGFGSTVTLVVSPPHETVLVPDVIGRSSAAADRIMHDAGLVLGGSEVLSESSIIASTIPAPSARAKFGSTVIGIPAVK